MTPEIHDYLDTGNKPPIRGDLLKSVVKVLVKKYCCKPIRAIQDRVGTFAYIMRDLRTKRTFYLIAKGSELYRDVISTQAILPVQARAERRPILLAWAKSDGVEFLQFQPDRILAENYGFNDRQGVRMINFSINQGRLIDPSGGIPRRSA